MNTTTESNEKTEHIHKLNTLASRYSLARARLAELQQKFETEQTLLRRRYRGSIKAALAKVLDIRDLLKEAIETRKDLFTKPKSRTMHGVKLGYRKKKGKIEWPKGSEDKVVARIRQHFPENADMLIDKVETPSKTALAKLSAAQLKKIGVSVVADTDELLIKDSASDLDKLIEQLLDSGEEDES